MTPLSHRDDGAPCRHAALQRRTPRTGHYIYHMVERARDPHQYQPKIDPAHWEAIRDFVREVATQTEGHVPYPVGTVYNTMTEFALWGWRDAALPLEIRAMLDRSVIAYYVQVGCGHLTAAARGNRRSILLRIAEFFATTPARRLPPMPASNPSAPYTAREQVSILSWARAQSTADRKRNAHVLLCLSMGAGLSAQEIIALRTRDVSRSGHDVDVRVHDGRQREVPMRSTYADLMPDLAGFDPNAFAFRPGRSDTFVNAISNFVRRANSGALRPTTQRMRATWLVHQLDSRVSLSVLAGAAGLDSLDALARFEGFMAPVAPDAAAAMLRGSVSTAQ